MREIIGIQITIKGLKFKTGDLVLVQNTEIEASLDKKMKARYNGPMIVVSCSKRGSYISAEMDGTVSQQKVAAFQVIPYFKFARAKVKVPENIFEWIDLSRDALQRVEEAPEDNEHQEKDYVFDSVKLRVHNDEPLENQA